MALTSRQLQPVHLFRKLGGQPKTFLPGRADGLQGWVQQQQERGLGVCAELWRVLQTVTTSICPPSLTLPLFLPHLQLTMTYNFSDLEAALRVHKGRFVQRSTCSPFNRLEWRKQGEENELNVKQKLGACKHLTHQHIAPLTSNPRQ